ncbi:MAG: response regulator transcription factor [Verrucomicrobiota bacterium]|jgi:two-component system phosphate regulon response regulator PhoB|nr:response regulator transcription factor [Verrucomicrobiota bacterium]
MNPQRILVVEDDPDIQALLRYHIEQHGYRADSVADGSLAADAARRMRPSLILLDLMLPGLDGLEVCRRLKSDPQTAAIPIIMVTARDEEADIVSGLELGAVDYICKPFRPREVMARIRAALRRDAPPEADTDAPPLRYRELLMDPVSHQATLHGEPVTLTAGEFRLLFFLAARPGRVFTREQIINAVRGEDYAVTDRSVDVQVAGLRRKLDDFGTALETVRSIGYRMKPLPEQ